LFRDSNIAFCLALFSFFCFFISSLLSISFHYGYVFRFSLIFTTPFQPLLIYAAFLLLDIYFSFISFCLSFSFIFAAFSSFHIISIFFTSPLFLHCFLITDSDYIFDTSFATFWCFSWLIRYYAFFAIFIFRLRFDYLQIQLLIIFRCFTFSSIFRFSFDFGWLPPTYFHFDIIFYSFFFLIDYFISFFSFYHRLFLFTYISYFLFDIFHSSDYFIFSFFFSVFHYYYCFFWYFHFRYFLFIYAFWYYFICFVHYFNTSFSLFCFIFRFMILLILHFCFILKILFASSIFFSFHYFFDIIRFSYWYIAHIAFFSFIILPLFPIFPLSFLHFAIFFALPFLIDFSRYYYSSGDYSFHFSIITFFTAPSFYSYFDFHDIRLQRFTFQLLLLMLAIHFIWYFFHLISFIIGFSLRLPLDFIALISSFLLIICWFFRFVIFLLGCFDAISIDTLFFADFAAAFIPAWFSFTLNFFIFLCFSSLIFSLFSFRIFLFHASLFYDSLSAIFDSSGLLVFHISSSLFIFLFFLAFYLLFSFDTLISYTVSHNIN